MSFQHITQAMLATWNADKTVPFYIEGPPGCGKTSMAFDLAKELGIDPRPHHQGGGVVIFRPSLRDPVDLMGTPNNDGPTTRWKPPHELSCMQEGKWLLVIDELPQGDKQMQNALAGLMLDRFVGELELSPDVYVMATGNRTKDKAGAGRVVSQLGNRVCYLQMDDPEVNEWSQWALANNIDSLLVAFQRWKGGAALLDFDPDRFSNATPRSWERVGRLDLDNIPADQAYSIVQGFVSEGHAAEYIGFRKHVSKLPNMDAIMLAPDKAPVPEEQEIRYVCVYTLASRTSDANYSSLMKYIERFPQDFQVLYQRQAIQICPAVMSTKTFTTWSTANQDVFK